MERKKTKLLNNIQIVNTGRVEHIQTPLSTISYRFESDESYKPNHGRIYSVDIKLGCNQVISEEHLAQDAHGVLHHTRKTVGRAIAEEVYGEVRRELIQLLVELRASGSYYSNPACKRVEKMLDMISYD
jgi:hypothetical protein